MIEIIKFYSNDKINQEDINILYKIHVDNLLYNNQLSHSCFCDEFKKAENRIYFFAKIENKIVGYLGVFYTIDNFEIIDIVVDKIYQKKGIGKVLLRYMMDEAKNKNVVSIYLEVDEKNKNAIEFYKNNGFDVTNIRKKYYKDSDALIMTRKI